MKNRWIKYAYLAVVCFSISVIGNSGFAQEDRQSLQEETRTTVLGETDSTSQELSDKQAESQTTSEEMTSHYELTTSQEPSTTQEESEPSVVPEAASGQRAIYRLYHPGTGEHLYTTDINEKNVLYGRYGWGYEGIAWYAPNAGQAVYRLYNPGLQHHLYTSDTNEVRVLTRYHGWVSDNNGNPVFYSGGSIPIYRLYNAGLRGLHHWTTDANEYSILPRHGWKQEGRSFAGVRVGNPIQTQFAEDEAIAAHIKSFGGYRMSPSSLRPLVAAIKELSRQRYSIGFMMMDVHTKRGIEYNADQQFYAASTVKGPFVASLAAKNPASIQESGAIMRQVLRYSSNEGYLFLVNRYHFTSWYPWLSEAGVRSSIGKDLYPYYSARELFKLWQRNYTYFTDDRVGQQVGLWFENPNFSPIKSVLGSQYRTRSKAGWISDWELQAASDAGIVYARRGPYIVSIMTNASARLDQLNGTVQALNTLVTVLNNSHAEMGQVTE